MRTDEKKTDEKERSTPPPRDELMGRRRERSLRDLSGRIAAVETELRAHESAAGQALDGEVACLLQEAHQLLEALRHERSGALDDHARRLALVHRQARRLLDRLAADAG
jgi:hypothetical protein